MSDVESAILIVDDEELVRMTLRAVLEEHRPETRVLEAESGEVALDLLAQHGPVDVVISDMNMPGMDGAELLREVSVRCPSATRILLTGQADVASAQAAINEGQIFRFLTKPCPNRTLLDALEAGREARQRATRDRALLDQTLRGNAQAREELARTMDELRRTQARLEQTSEDFEKLVFAASHDLREPARTVSLQVGLLREDGGEKETALAAVERAAQRMLAGLDALRDLARSGLETGEQPTALDQVVDQVVSDLGERIRATGARIEVGALPTVSGSSAMLAVLVRNLLDNALKFRRPTVPLVISVRAGPPDVADLEGSELREDAARTLEIADNGIGVAHDRIEQLFGLFVHLQSRAVYEGTHLGLAVCRRIAECHGGAIRAESRLGEGTRIRVTLPLAPKE